MNAHREDLRMVDDLDQSVEVRSLLRAGIDEDVSGYDFSKGLAAHMAAVAALPPAVQAPHAPIDAATVAGISGKTLLAWIGVPVASATVVAALWLGASSEPQIKHANKPVAQAPAPQSKAHGVSNAAPIGAPSAETAQVVEKTTATPRVSERAETRRTLRAQRNAAAIVVDHKAHHVDVSAASTDDTAAVQATEARSAANDEVQAQPTAAQREEATRQAAQQAEQERQAREEARRVAEERLKREMAQLMQAKQALNSNAARALSLAQAGEQEFRNSMFSEERQHVLLLALIKLGRVEEAERRAQPFLAAHPDSPFARRIRNALQTAK